MNQAQNQVQAFNLIMEGFGYLNRPRWVTPKKGAPYLACTVNAIMGMADAVEYVSIDCIVTGSIAKQVVQQLTADVEAKRKVIIGFRAGDPKPDVYDYPDRETGQPKQHLGFKARLLQVMWAKVNGTKVEIPLVPRNTQPESETPQGGHDEGDGAGSACGDESRARVPAHA
jgi:hypothetical protein